VPVKYKREGFRDHAQSVIPHAKFGAHPRNKAKTQIQRTRFMLITCSIAIIALFLFGKTIGTKLEMATQPELQGQAIITNKEILKPGTPKSAFVLHVDVILDDGAKIANSLATDEENWRALSEGQRVTVQYKLSKDRTSTQVRKILVEETPE
jgi:hypothetical protein